MKCVSSGMPAVPIVHHVRLPTNATQCTRVLLWPLLGGSPAAVASTHALLTNISASESL